jgi:alanyl-tRNA synthetase
VVARAADVAFDAGACVKQITAALGGRGGGRPELAQGAAADPATVLAFARDSVK